MYVLVVCWSVERAVLVRSARECVVCNAGGVRLMCVGRAPCCECVR